MNAGVVGEFGMERRGENLALAQTDHIAAHRGLNGRGDPTSATNGPRMNTSGKSFSTMESEEISVSNPRPTRNQRTRTRSPGSTKTAESPVAEPKSAVAANEPS